jgi:hypothetical protein
MPPGLPCALSLGQFTVYAVEKGVKKRRKRCVERTFRVPHGQHHDINRHRKASLPERFPAGAAKSIAINRAFEVALSQNKPDPRGCFEGTALD